MFGSFRVEDIKKMYHLVEPQKHYSKAFVEAFSKVNDMESDTIRQCRHYPNKHKHESLGMYSFDSLASPYYYVGAVICRLFRVSDFTRFSIETTPLMDVPVNLYIMDWATIFLIKWQTISSIIEEIGS